MTARGILLTLQEEWKEPRGKGLLTEDPKVKTLVRVLVTYREVRHILPNLVSLDPDADPYLLETVARFVARQKWLVTAVELI